MKRVLAGIAAAACLTAPVWACDNDDADGADIGLVLSGGGAFANTHIGVIRALEEEGVPVHCIVGTSMGSVVGGLYAAGWSPDEMRHEFETADWPQLITNTLGRENLPYREKDRQDEYYSDYIAGWGENGLILPSSVTTLRGLQGFYRDLLDEAPPDFDFDDLPIPYRAVATDLGTGQAVVLGDGDIVESMLASMSVPGLFDPREIDGRLLIDGGMSKQLPVDVAREMGADIIIVVDTTVEPGPPPANPSVVQVAQQLVQVQVWLNRTEQAELLTERDILIRPDLTGLATGAFERAGEGFESGLAAAEPYRERMREIAAMAAPPLHRPDAIAARFTGGARTVTNVRIDNETIVSDAIISDRFGIHPGDSVTRQDIREGLIEVAGLDTFGAIDAGFETDGTLTLRTEERPLGRNLFQAGITLSSSFEQDSRYVLRARYTRSPVNASGAQFSLNGAIGSDIEISAEWLQPFGRGGRFFYLVEGGYTGQPLALDIGGVRIDQYWMTRRFAGGRIGRDFGRFGRISVHSEYRNGEYDTKFEWIPDGGDVDLETAILGVEFELDTLDHPDFPTRGQAIDIGYRWVADLVDVDPFDDVYEVYQVRAQQAFSFGDWGVSVSGEVGSSEDQGNTLESLFFLGGFRNLTAIGERQLPNNDYSLVGIEAYRRLTPSDAVGAIPIWVGVLAEYGDFTLDLGSDGIFYGHTSSLTGYAAVNTLIGPAFFGYGYGQHGDQTVFVYIGREF
ncbi:patatin-like phospholipase family protein [Hyphobacterium sp. HN65]|uniref:Patatin-like phospholipase family protein n=1 Tax=Hyphobacterium lacteum TaxID=3116575 RepID=A0ABU7LS69_9PROT|nr:patatin-like phospholipase family protein [Hyphobacterium sp. HN65]MEE2526766.1 patatin-like phospholipase family protein [Hyphobacterium sp. HN65]